MKTLFSLQLLFNVTHQSFSTCSLRTWYFCVFRRFFSLALSIFLVLSLCFVWYRWKAFKLFIIKYFTDCFTILRRYKIKSGLVYKYLMNFASFEILFCIFFFRLFGLVAFCSSCSAFEFRVVCVFLSWVKKETTQKFSVYFLLTSFRIFSLRNFLCNKTENGS